MAIRVDDVDLVRDRALVERFQMGDPAAFDALYRRYFDRLVRYCQKRVGDPLEAEELAQEAFARALRALPSLEGERRFYPWMTVIAGRLCVDSHRRRGRSEPSAVIDLGGVEGGQEQVVDHVETEVLNSALERLASRHRDVLDLRERRGWSYQKIAQEYGVSLGTVEALLFRARKALKREFLAATGDERRWVALPVMGGVLRRLAAWRAKLEPGVAALPSLAGPVVAGVVAVSALSGVVAFGMSGSDGAGERPPAAVRLATTTAAAANSEMSVIRASGPDAAGAGATSPAGGGAAAGGGVLAAPRADTPVVDSVGADRAAEPQPVQGGVAGVVIGADPEAVAAETISRLDGYRNRSEPGARP